MRPLHAALRTPTTTLALVSAIALASPACGGGSSSTTSSASGTAEGTSGASSQSSSSAGTPTASEPTGAASDAGAAPAESGGASTASTAASDAGAAQPAEPPAPDVAMHVRSLTAATGWFRGIDIERRDDGSLLFRGQPVGRMTAGRITSVDGQPVPLTGRLSIGVRGRREHMEIQPDGSIRMDGGVLTIGPQGDVLISRRPGGPTQPVHVQITGYTPAAVRTADILLAYGIMRADLASR